MPTVSSKIGSSEKRSHAIIQVRMRAGFNGITVTPLNRAWIETAIHTGCGVKRGLTGRVEKISLSAQG
jgi:hypothetical protein